jgi:hypothetical protein
MLSSSRSGDCWARGRASWAVAQPLAKDRVVFDAEGYESAECSPSQPLFAYPTAPFGTRCRPRSRLIRRGIPHAPAPQFLFSGASLWPGNIPPFL